MKKWISRMVKFLVTGSFSLLIAACYGVMISFRDFTVKVRSNGESIENLKVTLLENGEPTSEVRTTDSTGSCTLQGHEDSYSTFQALIEDVDGEENGGEFKTETIELTLSETIVELEKLE